MPDPVLSYQRAMNRLAHVQFGLQSVFNGYWLGRLDRSDLDRVDDGFFARATEEVAGGNATYGSDKYITSGLADWERDAVQEHFPVHRPVVVTGAGSGREVVALLAMGYDARGFEPNRHLVAAGRRLLADRLPGHQARLSVSTRDDYPSDQAGVSVIIGWGSYMCIPQRSRRVALLSACREALAPDGAVLLSYFREAHHRRGHRVTAMTANLVSRLRGRDAHFEVGDNLSPNFVHVFTDAEVEVELAQAGLDVVALRNAPYPHAVARRTGADLLA